MIQAVNRRLRLLLATVLVAAGCAPGELAPPPSPTPLQPEVAPVVVQVVTPAPPADEDAPEQEEAAPDPAEPPAEEPVSEEESAPETEPAAEEDEPSLEEEATPTEAPPPDDEVAPAQETPPTEEQPAPDEETAPDEEPTPAEEASPDEEPIAEVEESTPTEEAAPDEEVDAAQMADLGEDVYTAECAACHQPDGQGTADFPALAGSATVVADDPTPVIDVVLHGRGEMPAFGDTLRDEELAAVVTYIRIAWDNEAPPVSPTQVQQVHAGDDVTPVEEAAPTPETETVPTEDEPPAEEEPADPDEAPPAEEPAQEPVSEEEAEAQALWQSLMDAQFAETWSTVPGKGEFYAGQHPHGALLTTYLNPEAELAMAAQTGAMPDGATIVKVSHDLEQVVQSFAVMQKRTGANPAHGDWYWAAYGPEGEVQVSGPVAGCIACHAAVRSNDYIFTFPLATLTLDEIEGLAPPAEPEAPEPPPVAQPDEVDGEPLPAEPIDAEETPADEPTPAEPTDAEETPEDEPTPAATPTPTETPVAEPPDEVDEAEAEDLINLGEGVYEANCASCHQSSGQGTAVFPALAGNPSVTDDDPSATLEVVIHGRGEMPSFGNILSHEEIAAVVSYIRTAWENDASPVTTATVQGLDEDEPDGEPADEPTPTPAEDGDVDEPEPEASVLSPEELVAMGQGLYTRACAACHQAAGEGVAGFYPPLAGNPLVLSTDPGALTHVVLAGRAGMPRFEAMLSHEEIAAILSYIRNAWGNEAEAVTPEQVRQVEEGRSEEQETPEPEEPPENDEDVEENE